MEPALETGQLLVISRLHYLLGEPARGDILVFHNPRNPQRKAIKRVVGLPGETVEFRDQHVFINGEPLDEKTVMTEPCDASHCQDGVWQVGQGEYFVLGDNRNRSSDSRGLGPIDRQYIIGEAVLRYWPLGQLDWIQDIGYTP